MEVPVAYYGFLDKGHPDDYRREEILKLVRAVQARENRLVLALPGVGTSNLLRFLVSKDSVLELITKDKIPERKVIFAYLDCDTLDDCADLEGFFEKIAGELHDQGLGDRIGVEERGYTWVERLLKRVGGAETDRIVIVVDQANTLLVAADKSFYRKLKALTDFNKRVCYIFAASPCIADTVDPDGLLFAGRRIPIGRLNARDCLSAITEEEWRLGVEFDTTTRSQLVCLTGGHPGLLRAVSSTIVGWLDIAESLDEAAERLLARDDVQYRCRKQWNALTAEQQTELQKLAHDKPDTVAEDPMTWLQLFGLVEQSKGAYRFCSAIMWRFVMRQSASVPPGPKSQDNVVPLEPVTIVQPTLNDKGVVIAGKVFKGDREIHVSRLVLRLIWYLKREHKICTKDEIATYVWYESQGKGVSDTAIEDLVRQARRRLGKEYIRVYWGQGYEFLG
jgi:hypothetical protein